MPLKKLGENHVPAAYYRIKFKDIFSFKELYVVMHDWLIEYGWSSVDCNGKIENDETFETLYRERVGGGGDKEIWIWWRLQKDLGNNYYKYHMDVDFHNIGIKDTEVMRDGKKFKANKGEAEIKVWAFLEWDYKGEFKENKITNPFSKIFPKRIFRKEVVESHKIELYREAYVFQAFMKKWMKLKSFLPYEELTPFHPSKAYPEWQKE